MFEKAKYSQECCQCCSPACFLGGMVLSKGTGASGLLSHTGQLWTISSSLHEIQPFSGCVPVNVGRPCMKQVWFECKWQDFAAVVHTEVLMKKQLHPSEFGVVFVRVLGITSLRGKTGMKNFIYAWVDNCLGFFFFHITLQIILSLLPCVCYSSCCAPGKKYSSLEEFSLSTLKGYSELITFLHEGGHIQTHFSQPGRQKGMLAVHIQFIRHGLWVLPGYSSELRSFRSTTFGFVKIRFIWQAPSLLYGAVFSVYEYSSFESSHSFNSWKTCPCLEAQVGLVTEAGSLASNSLHIPRVTIPGNVGQCDTVDVVPVVFAAGRTRWWPCAGSGLRGRAGGAAVPARSRPGGHSSD